jgi:hypothetical protein
MKIRSAVKIVLTVIFLFSAQFASSQTTWTLNDGNGKIVKQLFEGSQSKGDHELSINASDLTDSSYYILLETDGKQGLKKMIIAK